MGLGLGIVGKKVSRREAPTAASSVTTASAAEEAAAKRMKSAAAETPTARQQHQAHEPGSDQAAASAPIVFSGRLKKKLSGAHPAAPLSSRSEKDGPSSAAAVQGGTERERHLGDGMSSLLDDPSTATADDQNNVADASAVDMSGPVDDSYQMDTTIGERPPSADASLNMSVLTETEAGSAVNLTTGAVLMPHYSERSHSPHDGEGDDGVLERYLQLRQSRKLQQEEAGAVAPPLAPGRSQAVPQSRPPAAAVLASIDSGAEGGGALQQSVHDYSLIEEYVNAYKLNNQLPPVRESVFIAEERAQLGDLLPSSTQSISAAAQLGPRSVPARSPERPVSAVSAADTPSTPQRSPQPDPQLTATFVSARVKTFADAAVSPMPAPRTQAHPRFSAAEVELPSIAESTAEGIAVAAEEEVGTVGTSPRQSHAEYLAVQGSSAAASRAEYDWHAESNCAQLSRPSTSKPTSSTVATPPRQSRPATAPGASTLDMEQQLLSPFSEAVAFIENSKEPSVVAVRSSVSLHRSRSGENVEPNADVAAEEDAVVQEGGEYATYKEHSEASAAAYTAGVEGLLTKLEQKASAVTQVGNNAPTRSPLSSRPGTALTEGSARRSSNSATLMSAAGTPRKTERRKKAIRERVAGLLRQVAHAEMEYIAEFGFEAFEKEVGFFEENLPWLHRSG